MAKEGERAMGGFFGVASKESCIFDLFFGIDYHSHLGTRRGGMVLYNEEKGCTKTAHNSDFKIDDEVLHLGAQTFIRFVLDNMNGLS